MLLFWIKFIILLDIEIEKTSSSLQLYCGDVYVINPILVNIQTKEFVLVCLTKGSFEH